MNKEIIIAGKKIFYSVSGNGKPVMLVHGFGETGEVWKNQVAFLKDSFKLIVPDLPGSGQSEMIDDMSIEGIAEKPHQTSPKGRLTMHNASFYTILKAKKISDNLSLR